MTGKKTAGRTKRVLAFILLFGPAFILGFIGLQRCNHKFLEGLAPTYSFTDAEGKELSEKDFDDNIVLITTLKSTCPENCNLSFWHLDQDIFQRIRKNKKKLGSVRMITYVVDSLGNPVGDVTAINDMLYDRVENYDPEIWRVTGDDYKDLFDFPNNPELMEEVNGYFGEEDHWKLMLLIDRENHYRIAIEGTTEGLMRKMKHYIALLQKEYDKAAAHGE